MSTCSADSAVKRVAIIGGGPRATYALERLSMRIDEISGGSHLEVHVFESTGQFGAGRVHGADQTWTSLLNRTGDQVSFAADESMPDAGPLRPSQDRPTLERWVSQHPLPTNRRLPSGRWLPRRAHGMALSERFRAYAAQIDSHPRASTRLHPVEVVDLVARPAASHQPIVVVTGQDEIEVDDVLLVTGHAVHDPTRVAQMRRLAKHADGQAACYVPNPYPLHVELSGHTVPAGSVVAIRGTGLTALDVILELTAGRGGIFRRGTADGSYEYVPSGHEPGMIIPFSRSGVFPGARPEDLNQVSPFAPGGQGRFLRSESVARLRSSLGTDHRAAPEEGQLDFDTDVLPLAVLEMAYQYYGTLFGTEAADWLAEQVSPKVEAFLRGPRPAGTAPGALVAQLELAVDDLTIAMQRHNISSCSTTGLPTESALTRWAEVVALEWGDGALPEGVEATDPRFRFSWEHMSRPWSRPQGTDSRPTSQEEIVDLLETDARRARLGVSYSPHKAAANGVWRDLRSVISEAIDDGGLTPASQRAFLRTHVRHHNWFANGASPEAVGFLAALGRAGIVRLDTGPGAVEVVDGLSGFMVRGTADPKGTVADVLIEGHIRGFDPRTDRSPFYRNLLDRGLATMWVNTDGRDIVAPGGLRVDDRHHVIGSHGPDPRLTVLGAPLEGQKSFQVSALRPFQDHAVMREVIQWIEDMARPRVLPESNTQHTSRKQISHAQ